MHFIRSLPLQVGTKEACHKRFYFALFSTIQDWYLWFLFLTISCLLHFIRKMKLEREIPRWSSSIFFLPLNDLAKWFSVRLRTNWLWFWVQLQPFKLQISRLLRARSFLTFRQLQSVDSLWIVYVTWQEHTVKCTVQISTHNTTQSFKKMASLAKWLSVRLRTKWLWVRVQLQSLNPTNVYLVKANHRHTKKTWKTCSKLTIKTRERCHNDVVLVSLLLTLNIFHTVFSISFIYFGL